MGHHHHGREFPATVHGIMAKIITWILAVQGGCGIFLKLHILEKTVRPWVVPVHGVIGKAFPVIGWTQMIFGAATALGFCRDGNLGQCAAHYIMGSAFIGYAAVMVIMVSLGGEWLRRTGQSQEMLDSAVILIWVSHILRPLNALTRPGHRQYIYGAPWRPLDAQGHAAHHDGGPLVGRRHAGRLLVSQGQAVVCACSHVSIS